MSLHQINQGTYSPVNSVAANLILSNNEVILNFATYYHSSAIRFFIRRIEQAEIIVFLNSTIIASFSFFN